MQTISWILTMGALYGTWLNANMKREGFWWWLVSDMAFSAIFASQGMYAQSFLFAVYTILAVKGLVKWK